MLVFSISTSLCAAKSDGTSSTIANEKLESNIFQEKTDTLTRKKKLKAKMKHTGNILQRFFRSFNDYDTTYISPNYYNYTAMLQNTNYFQSYRLTGKTKDGMEQSITARPVPNIKVGPYFGWSWIFLGYTFDVSHPRHAGQSSEFNLSLYSALLGCDFVYIKNNGDYRLKRAMGFEGVKPSSVRGIDFSGMDANTLSFNAYYIFNHRHFSYPAAYNQSTVQRKSCGSWMIGAGFSKQHVSFDYSRLPSSLIGTTESPKIIEELKFSDINYGYYYFSGGYAYNWVFARNWLLGGSVMPSIGWRKAKGEKFKGKEILLDIKNLTFDCTSRLGLVWNNTHWFAGASFVSHLYMYRKSRLTLTNSVNYCNVYVGFFFHRKKAYRQ